MVGFVFYPVELQFLDLKRFEMRELYKEAAEVYLIRFVHGLPPSSPLASFPSLSPQWELHQSFQTGPRGSRGSLPGRTTFGSTAETKLSRCGMSGHLAPLPTYPPPFSLILPLHPSSDLYSPPFSSPTPPLYRAFNLSQLSQPVPICLSLSILLLFSLLVHPPVPLHGCAIMSLHPSSIF